MSVIESGDRLTTFERRERVLSLVRKQPGIRVVELAQQLSVSQGTIRNDLEALQEARRLARVRGGAIASDGGAANGAEFSARARNQYDAKLSIARWAAELVNDGDSILLDASTTVYQIAQFLADRTNLTVVTNGLEVARALAYNPTNSVILLGGALRADGATVAGAITERMLQELHVKLALVSATGISIDTGLTDDDIDQTHVKSIMVGSADSVVALVDSSKFGRRNLSLFAQVGQIARIFTDDALDPAWIEQFQRTSTTLTVCGPDTVASFTPARQETRHYRLGFANLTEQLLFPVEVRRGLERAAAQAGNIDMILADNNHDGRVALEAAESLIGQRLDVAIEYQIDAGAGDVIMAKFREAGIPVIAVDIPMVGATFFGVDNYRAGKMAGAALGAWLGQHWGGELDRLVVLEEPRAGPLPAARMRGQIDGLVAVVGDIPAEKMLPLDSGNTAAVAEAQVGAALDALPDLRRFAVVSFNDDVALGALAAARARGREEHVVVVGQGADRHARAEIRRPQSRLIGSTAYMPEKYGQRLIDLARQLANNQPVPPAVYMDHVFITRDNVDSYYPD
jgi:ribose transport system substrate-binding protein